MIRSPKQIRNFSIIAHIDHGKSTLADRFIELCGGLSAREMSAQVLDSMDLERERGITIKAQSVTLFYKARDDETYQFNLIDTPGHVDFSYEVSRSLAACEGALLVVDAAQGVQAQTLANCYAAMEQNLEVIPVLNKIDLPAAEPERVAREIEELIGFDAKNAIEVSAKTGQGVPDLLEVLIAKIPPPQGTETAPLQALIIDSWFDNYLGVVSLIRVKNGVLRSKDKIQMMSTHAVYEVNEVGIFTPKRVVRDALGPGEVGFVVAGIKAIDGAPVGDTITTALKPASFPLAGFKKVKPQVFAGLFPIRADDYELFREALAKLQLNDAALHYEPETSQALGFGFRCGFLGMLHMEIVQERLEREYGIDLIVTAPSVIYEVITKKNETLQIENPAKLPDPSEIKEILEPMVEVQIITPPDYLGSILALCGEKRGAQKKLDYLGKQVILSYILPMSEVVLDFFDRLKSCSRGYASLDYHLLQFESANLVKLEILVNGEKVDALATIVHRNVAETRGRLLAEKMRDLIPRQMFDIAIQAAIGSHVIARTTVKALRKNVTAKCYGGDVTRKRKLLEKQKQGKKRMKQIGRVEIPQDAFLAILQVGKNT